MTRTGRPPRAAAGRRLWRYTDLACRYATNLMLALAVIAAYAGQAS